MLILFFHFYCLYPAWSLKNNQIILLSNWNTSVASHWIWGKPKLISSITRLSIIPFHSPHTGPVFRRPASLPALAHCSPWACVAHSLLPAGLGNSVSRPPPQPLRASLPPLILCPNRVAASSQFHLVLSLRGLFAKGSSQEATIPHSQSYHWSARMTPTHFLSTSLPCLEQRVCLNFLFFLVHSPECI